MTDSGHVSMLDVSTVMNLTSCARASATRVGCGFIQARLVLAFTHTTLVNGSVVSAAQLSEPPQCVCYPVRAICVPTMRVFVRLFVLFPLCVWQVVETVLNVSQSGDSKVIPDTQFATGSPRQSFGILNPNVSGMFVFPQSGLSVIQSTPWELAYEAGFYDDVVSTWALLDVIPVPIPNSTWTVNGTKLVSYRPVAGPITNPESNSTVGGVVGIILPAISNWNGLGMIVLQASQETTFVIEVNTGPGVWALIGGILGSYGGMYVFFFSCLPAFAHLSYWNKPRTGMFSCFDAFEQSEAGWYCLSWVVSSLRIRAREAMFNLYPREILATTNS